MERDHEDDGPPDALSTETMPLADRRETFTFPALPKATYLGLPAILANVLPDEFGNGLIDA